MDIPRIFEIVFAFVAYGMERWLDYVRVNKPGTMAITLGCVGFFLTFAMSVTVATLRYRRGKYFIDWLHIIAAVVTIVASFLEFLQLSEFIALKWFTEYPTIIAKYVLEFNLVEALVVASSEKPHKAPQSLTALPNLADLMIFGELKEGKSVYLTGIVTGDVQGCVVEWYSTDSSSTFERELDMEPHKCKFYESYTIPLEAVGKYLVAKFIPTTLDGRSGEPLFANSEKAIEAELPRCTFVLVTGDIIEGGLLTASYQYTGGREKDSYHNWYIHEEKEQRGVMPEAWSLEYIIPKHAIGSFISFTCTPRRDDGKEGSELTWTGPERVSAGHPTVKDVRIQRFSSNSFIGVGKYFGGDEGDSLFRWYKERSGEGRIPIVGANRRLYKLRDDDYGWSLVFSYVPARSDSQLGEPRFSQPTALIFPELIRIGVFEIKGEARVGETLLAYPHTPSEELQKWIWKKFAKTCKYQWSVSMQDGTGYTPSGDKDCYTVKAEDVGRSIQCRCTMTDAFHRESLPAFAVTDAVVPGILPS